MLSARTSLQVLLKAERLRQELSMNALAARAGLSQQMVSYVERGMRKPTLGYHFSDELGLDVSLSAVMEKALTKRTGRRG